MKTLRLLTIGLMSAQLIQFGAAAMPGDASGDQEFDLSQEIKHLREKLEEERANYSGFQIGRDDLVGQKSGLEYEGGLCANWYVSTGCDRDQWAIYGPQCARNDRAKKSCRSRSKELEGLIKSVDGSINQSRITIAGMEDELAKKMKEHEKYGEIVKFPPGPDGFARVLRLYLKPVEKISEIQPEAAFQLDHELRFADGKYANGQASITKDGCTYIFDGAPGQDTRLGPADGTWAIENRISTPQTVKSQDKCEDDHFSKSLVNQCKAAFKNQNEFSVPASVTLVPESERWQGKSIRVEGESHDVFNCLHSYGFNPPKIQAQQEWKDTTENGSAGSVL